MPRSKFNQRGKEALQWTLQNADEINWKGHKMVETCCALEESIWLTIMATKSDL
jgi:hypothetical protein